MAVGWFGLGRFIMATGIPTGSMFAQVLAVAWLVIVVATAVRQVRTRRTQFVPSGERKG